MKRSAGAGTTTEEHGYLGRFRGHPASRIVHGAGEIVPVLGLNVAKEMLRLLQPLRVCIVQVPIQSDLLGTIEQGKCDPGEFNRVRRYGHGFEQRLAKAGFMTDTNGSVSPIWHSRLDTNLGEE